MEISLTKQDLLTDFEAKIMLEYSCGRIDKISKITDMNETEQEAMKSAYSRICMKIKKFAENPSFVDTYLDQKKLFPITPSPQGTPKNHNSTIPPPSPQTQTQVIIPNHLSAKEFQTDIMAKLPPTFSLKDALTLYCEVTQIPNTSGTTNFVQDTLKLLVTNRKCIIAKKGVRNSPTTYAKYDPSIVSDSDSKRFQEINKALVPDAILQRQ